LFTVATTIVEITNNINDVTTRTNYDNNSKKTTTGCFTLLQRGNFGAY